MILGMSLSFSFYVLECGTKGKKNRFTILASQGLVECFEKDFGR
jgi:hypothetical protein